MIFQSDMENIYQEPDEIYKIDYDDNKKYNIIYRIG